MKNYHRAIVLINLSIAVVIIVALVRSPTPSRPTAAAREDWQKRSISDAGDLIEPVTISLQMITLGTYLSISINSAGEGELVTLANFRDGEPPSWFRVSPVQMQSLRSRIKETRFFLITDDYAPSVPDAYFINMTIAMAGRSNSVIYSPDPTTNQLGWSVLQEVLSWPSGRDPDLVRAREYFRPR